MSEEKQNFRASRNVSHRFLIAGAVFLVAALGWGAFDARQFAFSWLFAFTTCFTLCAGALFWILLHHVVDARWSVVVRRVLENAAALFAWLAVGFVPLIFVAPELWKWMTLQPGEDVLLDHKAAYLNEPFFWFRAIFYFAFFAGASILLRGISIGQDEDGNPNRTLLMRKISYACIPLFAGCLTFAAVDWLMGLDFHWFSTMWGVYLFSGAVVGSMALLILIANWLHAAGWLPVLTEEHNHIMGKLLFAFLIFWAYIAFSQYFLIYYGNIPEETTFFRDRNAGNWFWVSILLVVAHFIVPFFLLLTQPAKRNAKRLCFSAAWALVMHVIDVYWIVMPAKGGNAPHALDFLSLAGMFCLLAFWFLKNSENAAVYPLKDPRLEESIHLKN